jgi:hypothetical protein
VLMVCSSTQSALQRGVLYIGLDSGYGLKRTSLFRCYSGSFLVNFHYFMGRGRFMISCVCHSICLSVLCMFKQLMDFNETW